MRSALIIANTEYTDPGLAQLTAPGKDAEDFARVLKEKDTCAFDEVNILLNQPEYIVRGSIDEFFDQKKPDDLLVLYFSGHGVRDELGSLYLAVKNTIRTRLRSTAIKSDYIREAMDQSRSKRQVLILDCCNSGAFAQGAKAATGVSIGTATAFEVGYGRIILTASDSTQFAWEGDKVIGETQNSLFTHYLVEGLEGEADLDGDGRITVDELYDYVYEEVRLATPKQTPSKFSSKQQGEIVLRQNIPIEEIKLVPLPAHLLDTVENPDADVRLGIVQSLTKLLIGKNKGLARSARETLERIAASDDSRRVSEAAAQALEAFQRGERAKREEERRAKHEILRKQATQGKFTEKITEETSHQHQTEPKIIPVSSNVPRKSLWKWAWAAGIAGGLCIVLFWISNMVWPQFALGADHPTITMTTIVFTAASTIPSTITPTFTIASSATASLVTTSTDILPTGATELFPSQSNNNDTNSNLIIPTRPPTLVPTLAPTFTLAPTLTATAISTDTPPPTSPCGTLPTRVVVGRTIQVTTSGQVTRLGIRPELNLDAHKMFELLPGDQMNVLNGPVCSNDSYFWYITSQKGDGWVREGNGVFYFVDPVP